VGWSSFATETLAFSGSVGLIEPAQCAHKTALMSGATSWGRYVAQIQRWLKEQTEMADAFAPFDGVGFHF
jgi:hypothetical protein